MPIRTMAAHNGINKVPCTGNAWLKGTSHVRRMTLTSQGGVLNLH